MCVVLFICFFFFSSRRRHTRLQGDWSSDVCSSDLPELREQLGRDAFRRLRLHGGAVVDAVLRAQLDVEQAQEVPDLGDRKSTRLNSSHLVISYAVFCLKKKNERIRQLRCVSSYSD